MMHALGYGIDLIPLRQADDDSRVGTRITKQLPKEPSGRGIRVAFGGQVAGAAEDPLILIRHAKEVMSILEALDDISTVEFSYDRGRIRIQLEVFADNKIDAMAKGALALRTAIHTAGGGTPGWDEMISEMMGEFRINVAPDCLA